MKEQHFFFTPQIETGLLPSDEAAHALRVLRLKEGDALMLMDGRGSFYEAALTEAHKDRAAFRLTRTLPQQREWAGHLHLALAPTKNMERTEWAVEKMTEIGFDELSLINCDCSERRVVKTERLQRIIVSAVKQSRKAWCPQLHEMTRFADFLRALPPTAEGATAPQRFICHCQLPDLPELRHELRRDTDALVLVGPEGDFSPEEISQAEACGFHSVSLGRSRLRTETAAVVATHLMHLCNS